MQFQGQRQTYLQNYPDALDWIVLMDGDPAGRLCVNSADEHIAILDIELMPERRGQGIGTLLIRDVIAKAGSEAKSVRLSVARENVRAFRLYERLGFTTVSDGELYIEMEWEAK